ncbi:glycoside hydrolase family 2 protein [Oerskovia sp. Root22]|uniref:glycoside hydrolase family 2 protein n=1 Tax=Oerskovia sp. Root22 TaxID=1736494 RepID=UPI000B1DCF3A|nr:hypothetical protein [Oerskovia sp. Root22]
MTDHQAHRTLVAREVHEGWTLSIAGGSAPQGAGVTAPSAAALVGVPATVPGSVHTDLLAAGLIPDPYLDDNEALLGWVGRSDWEYRTTLTWTVEEAAAHERHDLVFDGLDTVAEVRLNGRVLGSTVNMHRTYRFDVSSALQVGGNDLVVRFASPVRYADRQSLALGYRPQVNRHPFNAIRKMACSFGWDWGLDTTTSGIWRPVRLESWTAARLSSVRVEASVADGAVDGAPGRVRVQVEIERNSAESAAVRVAVNVAGVERVVEVASGASSAIVDVVVPSVDLWWPRGYGDQPLHDVDVVLSSGLDLLGSASRRVGFRAVRLEMEPDEHGTSFRFVVNDQPVFVRGANWIPDDAFPHRVTRERYAARIAQAERANINLLRVWGGGIYEADDFYDLCDERGILTWQDFLFACAAYAEEETWCGSPTTPRSCCGTAATRTSGAIRTGTGRSASTGAPGASGTTPSCCRESWPSSTRRATTRRRAPGRGRSTCTRTTPRTDRCTRGSSGTGRTTRTTATSCRVSSPSSAGRARPPGRRSRARSATTP